MTETNEAKRERAVLVGLTAANMPEEDRSTETSMAELEALLETAGGEAAATVLQSRPSPDPRTFIGSGKAAEIKEIIDAEKLDLALFDNELSPSQARALGEELGVRVLDRSGIILDIFAGRARSREGRLQVELAQYKYLLPRLTGMWTHLVRQTASGGSSPIGTRGPGETQLETDRRHIRRRIQKLEEELEDVRRVRGTQRRVREKNETPVVALIGYTNAGKSTLLNAMTGESIQTGDRLFDTLDTTTRRFSPDGVTEALISDTVGFIRKLPTQLVEAFKATLEELVEAEVLLHVIDVSNPDWRAQARVVESLVASLGAGSIPRIDVYNKCDRAADYPAPGKGSVAISALTGRGLDELNAKIAEVLNAGVKRVKLLIPYSRSSLLDTLHGDCVIDSLEYTDDGVRAEVRCPAAVFPRIKDFVIGGSV
jgi:GTP-binding protein HflX